MTSPIHVYLDSDDLSLLSDPRRMDQTLYELRTRLEEYANGGQVIFRFSMAHVCEAAPTTLNAQEAAARRAALIKSLCKGNALAPIDEIWEAEVSGNKGFSPFTEGRWFPPLDDLLPESSLGAMKTMLSEELKAKGLTRQQRRQQERKVFDKNGMTAMARAQMDAAIPTTAKDLLGVFPFEQHEVDALTSYYRGGAGRDIVGRAVQRILADPTWFMERFAADPEKMRGIAAWLRQGGADFATNMSTAAANAQQFFENRRASDAARLADIEIEPDPRLRALKQELFAECKKELDRLIAKTRRDMEENILRRIAAGVGAQPNLSKRPLPEIQEACPGIAATVAVGVHAVKRAIEETQPRPLKASDFGDAMHATYAPYMDVYRTDGFMADAVAPILQQRGVALARRLRELPALIDQRLLSRV